MRKIELPSSNTLRFSMKLGGITGESPGIVMPDGYIHQSIGNIGAENFDELEIARQNGAKVLWGTSSVKKRLEEIILNYFLGSFKGHDSKRQLFHNEVLQSSSFQLSFKKELIKKITEQSGILKGKDSGNIQSQLKKIISWRNAFAHGEFQLDANEETPTTQTAA